MEEKRKKKKKNEGKRSDLWKKSIMLFSGWLAIQSGGIGVAT